MTHFPSLSATGERRQARLADARLMVVTDRRAEQGDLAQFLTTVCEASADVILLRDKTATEDELRAAAGTFRSVADRFGALFILNDLPGLACQTGADGVQVGQHDVHPDHARTVCGPDLLVGRTCLGLDDLSRAAGEDVDYLELGPILVPDGDVSPLGLGPLALAAKRAATPWFAFGGITADHVGEVLDAGARRVVVGRAAAAADDLSGQLWSIRRALGAVHG